MFKRIGLSAAALLAAIAFMQAPASAQDRNYGAPSGHYTSNRYTPSVQNYTPFVQNRSFDRNSDRNVGDRNDRRPDDRTQYSNGDRNDRRQTERNFQSHRDHDDWNARNSSRW